jgi:hypothetical protein
MQDNRNAASIATEQRSNEPPDSAHAISAKRKKTEAREY